MSDAQCNAIVGNRTVAFMCDLGAGHDGPHRAAEDINSVRERDEWVRQQRLDATEPPSLGASPVGEGLVIEPQTLPFEGQTRHPDAEPDDRPDDIPVIGTPIEEVASRNGAMDTYVRIREKVQELVMRGVMTSGEASDYLFEVKAILDSINERMWADRDERASASKDEATDADQEPSHMDSVVRALGVLTGFVETLSAQMTDFKTGVRERIIAASSAGETLTPTKIADIAEQVLLGLDYE